MNVSLFLFSDRVLQSRILEVFIKLLQPPGLEIFFEEVFGYWFNFLICLRSIEVVYFLLNCFDELFMIFFFNISSIIVCSVQFTRYVVSNSLWPHGPQHSRPPCPSPTPGVYSNSNSLCVIPTLTIWFHPKLTYGYIKNTVLHKKVKKVEYLHEFCRRQDFKFNCSKKSYKEYFLIW